MGSVRNSSIKDSRTAARIVAADDGGPIRTIINGRRSIPTGFVTAIKAGFSPQPHESKWEKAVMYLAEASPYVQTFLAQPHRLEMYMSGERNPLIYFPDLFLVDRLDDGEPFSDAAMGWEPSNRTEYVNVLLEIKGPKDKRAKEHDYVKKLELADEVYRRVGFRHFVVEAAAEICPLDLKRAREVTFGARQLSVSEADLYRVREIMRRLPNPRFVEVAEALGGGKRANNLLYSLHVRGFLEIDLMAFEDASIRWTGKAWPTDR
jgi:hypothetical protein